MNNFSSIPFFRFSSGRLECDEGGLRIGDVALLARDARGVWATRDEHDVRRDLSRVNGFPVDVRAKMAGFGAVAKALKSGDIAKAQVTALLLRLPDPLPLSDAAFDKSRERRLRDLVACGLLKADGDWEDKHPRTGAPPNPGWFASKPKEAPSDDPPKAAAKPNESTSSGSPELTYLPPTAGVNSLLARNLPRIALTGLARLAARVSVATILFDAIFIPSANPIVEEGPVPGRPDMTYRWAHDTAEVTFSALINGEWRIFAGGKREGDVFRGQDGAIIARIVPGPGGRGTLLTSLADLDRALADLRSANSQPAVGPTNEDHEPRLCPDPTPEPKTTKSANSIAYQEYVSKLPYGWRFFSGPLGTTAAIRRRATCSRPRRTSTSCLMRTTICTFGLIRKATLKIR